jgi:hypothetical protein
VYRRAARHPRRRAWLDGPLVREWRTVIAPSAGPPHPFLRVIFDTRVYSDGDAHVSFTVENVLNQTGATTTTTTSRSMPTGNRCLREGPHFYLTRRKRTTSFHRVHRRLTAPFNIEGHSAANIS